MTKALGLIYLTLGSVVAAIPENIEPRLLGGVCQPYGGYFQSSTGNGMVGRVVLQPAGTGTYIDGLDTGVGSVLVQQRMTNPWYYVSCLPTPVYHHLGNTYLPKRHACSSLGRRRHTDDHLQRVGLRELPHPVP